MLFVVDVGNTHTVMGLIIEEKIEASWRISTDRDKTADEYLIIVRDLLDVCGAKLKDIEAVAIASVVPSATAAFVEFAHNRLQVESFIVSEATAIDLPLVFPRPEQIGADRLANAYAGIRHYGAPLIVVDFGTAITFDIIDSQGRYLGGLIVPGIQTASEALFQKAALLTKVDLNPPVDLIGSDTSSSVQSGIINGFTCMVDGLIEKISRSLEATPIVVATGGQAGLIADRSELINIVDPDLTIKGISLLYNARQPDE